MGDAALLLLGQAGAAIRQVYDKVCVCLSVQSLSVCLSVQSACLSRACLLSVQSLSACLSRACVSVCLSV
jgi:hypothetical protein